MAHHESTLKAVLRLSASTLCLLAVLACCFPVIADDELASAPESIEELLGYRLKTGKGALFRVFPLSSVIFYAVFDSNQTRARVFEGVAPELLAALATPASLTLLRAQLDAAYQETRGSLKGEAREFREALAAVGFLGSDARAGERRVLMTMIQSASVRGAIACQTAPKSTVWRLRSWSASTPRAQS